MRDMFNNVEPKRSTSPVSVGDDTAEVGEIIDLQDTESLTFLIATGALADAAATFAVLLEEGDDSGLSDAAAVADADMLGTEALAGFTEASDDKVFKLGYIGTKRYVRLTITPTGNAAAALMCVIALRGHVRLAPTANPPA